MASRSYCVVFFLDSVCFCVDRIDCFEYLTCTWGGKIYTKHSGNSDGCFMDSLSPPDTNVWLHRLRVCKPDCVSHFLMGTAENTSEESSISGMDSYLVLYSLFCCNGDHRFLDCKDKTSGYSQRPLDSCWVL